MEKMTGRKFYEILKGYAMNANDTDAADFCDKQIAAIDKKNEKARERAAKKASEDVLMDAVMACLTNEFQTADDILKQIDVADVTKAKVSNRLSRLAADGTAVKDTVKVEKRTLVAYRMATAE